MKTAVVTDSNSGITPQEAQELGIFLMHMPVIINDEVYYQEEGLTEDDFYQSLTGGKEVLTSQPSPGDVLDLWESILNAGYDELVYIPMSSGLSASCGTAIGLSLEYENKVFVVDNHRISVTMRQSVMEALAMTKQGLSAREIQEDLQSRAYDSSIYIAVDTLEFLKKGGRITPAAAALGSVLNIKPILSIQGGKLDAFAKVRGIKKCKARMIEALKADRAERFGSIPDERLQLTAAGAGLTPEEQEDWRAALAEAFPTLNVRYNPLSYSIGTHTGPGARGVGLSVVKEGLPNL